MNESEMIKKAMPVCLEPLNDKYRPVIKKALEEVQQYRAIGTVEECRAAVEKMKPKKTAIEAIKVHICPVCGSSGIYDYCGNCGQRVQMLSD